LGKVEHAVSSMSVILLFQELKSEGSERQRQKDRSNTYGLPSLAILKAMSALLMFPMELARRPVLAIADGSKIAAATKADENSGKIMLRQ